MRYTIVALLVSVVLLPRVQGGLSSGEPHVFNVVSYGAIPDGLNLCTASIQKAIDACAAAKEGVVLFPNGRFLTGTLFLRSGVTLRLKAGATLLGSTNITDYPETLPKTVRSYMDRETQMNLIYGERLTNVTITGDGVIDGQGGAWPKLPRGAGNRPFVIRLVGCRNVRVADVTLRNSGFWMQHYLECDDLTIRGIRIVNHANWNNDAIDIDSCHHALVENCDSDTSDDGVTLKSTTLRACENVTVSNCLIRTHAVGIKFGTESIGGFKHIRIQDCDIEESAFRDSNFGGRPNGKGGIGLMSLDGAALEDVEISNIHIQGTMSPIFMRLQDRGRIAEKGKQKPIGYIRNVTLSDITATNAEITGSLISGIPGHPIENLTLRDIRISTAGGGKQANVKSPSDELVKAGGAGPGMFGLLPASGIFFYHVNGLILDHVVIETKTPDERPGLAFCQVKGLELNGRHLSAESSNLPPGVGFLMQYVVPLIRAPATSAKGK